MPAVGIEGAIIACEQALSWGYGEKRPGSEVTRRGEGKGEGRGNGKGGEPVEKLLSPLFNPFVTNLMIICQQGNYQRLVAMECKQNATWGKNLIQPILNEKWDQ